MFCSKCQAQNPEGAKFCQNCASPLSIPSPAPKQPNSPQPIPHPQPTQPLALLIAFLILFLAGGGLYAASKPESLLKSLITKFIPAKKEESPDVADKTNIIVEKTPQTTAKINKYLKDTDNDGFPDFLEKGTGYDLTVADCAQEANCQGTLAGINPKKENNVLFILDSSGSMAGQAGGRQKMAAAKTAINSYIDRLPAEVNAGLMVYGHKGSNNEVDKAVSCQGIELLYPISKVDKNAFKNAVASFSPTGWTPITDSLTKAGKEAFVNKEGHNNSIILVSDGIETCEGNPCQVAADLKSAGIMMKVDVVGFDVDAPARQQLQCIAQVTGGQYYHVRSPAELNQAFDQFAKNSETLVKTANCLADNFFAYASCLDKQIIASQEYLDQEKIKALDAGDIEKEKQLDAVVKRLNKKYEEFKTGFEKEYTSDVDKMIEKYEEKAPDYDLDELDEIDEADFELYQKLTQ